MPTAVSYRRELDLGLRRLRSFCAPTPMIRELAAWDRDANDVAVVGSGCSLAVAEIIAEYLRTELDVVVRATTPLNLRTDRKSPSRVVFVSRSGSHSHSLDAAQHLSSSVAAILVCAATNSPLERALRRRRAGLVVLRTIRAPVKGGYIPVEAPISLLGVALGPILLNAASGIRDMQQDVADQCHVQRDDIARANTIEIVHTGYETAAAIDLETRMAESGILFPTVSDAWNFAHGRFILTSRSSATLMVLLSARRGFSASVADRFGRIVESHHPLLSLRHPSKGLTGSLESYLQCMGLVAVLGRMRGIDPALTQSPSWGTRLYNQPTRSERNT